MRRQSNLEKKDFFQLTLELFTGAQLCRLRSMIFVKEELQSNNPTTVPAQSGALSLSAVCRKRQTLSTRPRYLPSLTRTNLAEKRHYHNRATVLPCDRQTSKQVWKEWFLTPVTTLNFRSIRKSERQSPINLKSYIILFLKAINTLLDTFSNC
jgi:hypothetical protein